MLNPFSAKAERHVISPLAPVITPPRGEEGDTGGEVPEGGSGVPAGSPSDPLSPRCCCSGAARVPLALLPACAPAWLLQPLAMCRESSSSSSSSSSSGGRRNESHEGPWRALGSVALSTHLPRFCLARHPLLPEVLPGTHRTPQGGVPSPVPPKMQLPLLPGLQEQRSPAGVAPSCLGGAAKGCGGLRSPSHTHGARLCSRELPPR